MGKRRVGGGGLKNGERGREEIALGVWINERKNHYSWENHGKEYGSLYVRNIQCERPHDRVGFGKESRIAGSGWEERHDS